MGGENRQVDAFDLGPEPDWSDFYRSLERRIKVSIRTHVPASIVTFEPTTSLAVVAVGAMPVVKLKDETRPPVGMVARTGKAPNANALLQPIQLTGVPVVWPSAAAGKLTIPLVAGDTGELHVHDRSISAWLLAGAPVDPVLACTHWLKDSTFHPGLRPTASPTTVDPTATVLDGALAVKIGAAATLAAARTTDAVAASAALTTWALQVETYINGLVPGSITPLFATFAATMATIAGGSTKVKVE